ncbi:MAG: glycosyltransferase [Planctomycetota bacterium]
MKVVQVNKYLEPRAGADIVMLRTARLLRRKGHEVVLMGMEPRPGEEPDFPTYSVCPVDYDNMQFWRERAAAAGRLLYSLEAKRCMQRLIERERPDVIHFHNIYHQLSPSIIDAAAEAGVPCGMTLHDYKLTCGIYCHNRRGIVCEKCRDGRYLNVLRYRCTENSLPKSLLNAVEMYLHHTVLRIYRQVDAFIAPSQFMKDKMQELGFRGRFVRLPYFLDADDFSPSHCPESRRIVYFGRLAPEKGLFTLLDAMQGLDLHLEVVGRGPLEKPLERKVARDGLDNVSFEGFQQQAELRRTIAGCRFAVVPSIWYENYPVSVMEAFALGKPVVGADIGGIPELIGDDRGLLFEPGSAEDLQGAMQRLSSDPGRVESMGRNARSFVERELSPEEHYEKLCHIYRGLNS